MRPIEVILDFEDDLNIAGVPRPIDPMLVLRLMNKAIEEIAIRTHCIQHDKIYQVDSYLKEGRFTADALTNTTTIVDTELSSTTDSYYVGWRVTNITRGAATWVTAYTGATQTMTVNPPVTGQTTADSYIVERLEHELVLPEDFIQEDFLQWEDNHWLRKASREEVKRFETSSSILTGDPEYYHIDSNKLKLYPRPSSSDIVRMSYFAKPYLTTIGKTKTASVATTYIYLPDEFIKSFPSSRLVGAALLIISGTYEADETTIRSATSGASGLQCYVYPSFSGNIAQSTEFCTLIDLPEDFHHAIKHYMLWNYCKNRTNFAVVAQNALAEWQAALREIDNTMLRRKNPKQIKTGTRGTYPGFTGEVVVP